jgi:SulP family sulfate permease
MLHSIFLLLFMLIAAPLAGYIPLPSLAGVLVVVAWNMAEKEEFFRLLKAPSTALVLGATFGLTLIHDLIAGIVAGCVIAAILALMRRGVSEEGA